MGIPVAPMETTRNESAPLETLACRSDEARRLLGGISCVTMWRLEKRGLIRAVNGVRTKLYVVQSLRDFVAGKAGNS